MKRVFLVLCILIIVHLQYGSVLFYDDFNREEATAVGNDWVNIGPVSPIIENGAMKITSSSLQGVRREFSDLGITSGIYFISFDWKITSNNWLADAFPNGTTTYIRHDYEGNLYYDNTSDFSDPINIGNLTSDTFTTVKMKVNIDTNQFSIWLNENLVAENITGQSVTDFSRFTFRAGSGSTVTQYVDNFILYDETAPEAPENLLATNWVNQIILNWSQIIPNDFLMFRIYRDSSSPAVTYLTEVSGSAQEFVDTTVQPNTNYYYRIKVIFMGSYESDFSTEATAHLQPVISISEETMDIDVGFGYTYSTNFSINNVGEYPLDYQIFGSASEEFGTGQDGNLYVEAGTTFIPNNIMTTLSSTANPETISIAVTSTSDFIVNDEIMIITMQSDNSIPNNNAVGQYETKHIINIDNDFIEVDSPIDGYYNTSNGSKHVVLKVPNYNNVTIDGEIKCTPWNGNYGGIVLFRVANQMIINSTGSIDSSFMGYRGGSGGGGYCTPSSGVQGEGITGGGNHSDANNVNGGGGGLCSDGGGYPGAGGGHGSNGAIGYRNTGGCSVGVGQPDLLLFGGGGGGGGKTVNGGYPSEAGGKGAGIIKIFAYSVCNNGSIISSGQSCSGTFCITNGGGGAGGTINLTTNEFEHYGTISAIGGSANNVYSANGSVGRIFLNREFSGNGSIDPAPRIFESRSNVYKGHLNITPISGCIEAGQTHIINLIYNTSFFSESQTICDTLIIQSNSMGGEDKQLIINADILPGEMIPTVDLLNIFLNANNNTAYNEFQLNNDGIGKVLFDSEITSDNNPDDNPPSININTNSGIIEANSSFSVSVSADGEFFDYGIYNYTINYSALSISSEFELSIPVIVRVDYTPPMTPLDLTFEEDQSDMHQIYLAWEANALADSVYSYQIYRKGVHDTEWSLKGNVDANQTWFIDNQFTGMDTTAVSYKLTAIDWVGNESEPSEEVMAWLQRFVAPSGLQLEIINNRHVKLDWTPVTSTISGNEGTPACYVIYRSELPSPPENFYFVAAVDEPPYTHQWAAWFNEEDKLYYIVTAYGGDFEDIIRYTSKDSIIRYGNLDSFIRNKKLNHQEISLDNIPINDIK